MIQEGNDASFAVARKLGMSGECKETSPDGTPVHQFGVTFTD
jgi:hypothetical protein